MRYLFTILLFFTVQAYGQGMIIDPYRYGAAAPALLELFANARSIDLDGTAEYVSVPDANDLSMTDGAGNDLPYTITAWMYQNDIDASAASVLSKYTGGAAEFSFATTATNGYLRAIMYNPAATIYIGREYQTAIPTGQWVHVAMSYTAATETAADIDLYVNGINVDNADVVAGVYAGMTAGAANVEVGSLAGAALFEGKLDQVCLFRNVALSLSEIKEVMTIRDITQFTYYDSLVLYQEYDSPDTLGTGGIVDLSPAGNNGTMQNGEYADLNECITWPYSYQLDTSASYANLTPMQSAADTSFGGFMFDVQGGIDYIQTPDNDAFTFLPGDAHSFSVWFKDSDGSPTSPSAALISKWLGASSNPLREWQFYVTSTGIGAIIDGTGTGTLTCNVNIGYSLLDLQWHHVVMSNTNAGANCNCDDITFYVDGTNVGSAANGTGQAMVNGDAPVTISDGSFVNPFSGAIADVLILDTTLTDQQVANMYNNHAPRNELLYHDAEDIIAYYRGYNSGLGSDNIINVANDSLNATGYNFTASDFQYTYPREIFDAPNAGSFDFDGSTEYITIADSDSLSFIGNDGTDTSFTIAAWIYMVDATRFRIASKYTNAVGLEWQFATEASDFLLFFRYDNSSGGAASRTSTAALTAYENQWIHVVATLTDGGTVQLYVNGAEVAASGGGSGSYTAMENTAAPVNIGALQLAPSTQYANGKMGHITIVKNIPLTLCQIQELYNDGSPIDPRDATFWNDSFIHYKLDQSDDPTTAEGIKNISPNGSCNGTAVNQDATNISTTSYPTN